MQISLLDAFVHDLRSLRALCKIKEAQYPGQTICIVVSPNRISSLITEAVTDLDSRKIWQGRTWKKAIGVDTEVIITTEPIF